MKVKKNYITEYRRTFINIIGCKESEGVLTGLKIYDFNYNFVMFYSCQNNLTAFMILVDPILFLPESDRSVDKPFKDFLGFNRAPYISENRIVEESSCKAITSSYELRCKKGTNSMFILIVFVGLNLIIFGLFIKFYLSNQS